MHVLCDMYIRIVHACTYTHTYISIIMHIYTYSFACTIYICMCTCTVCINYACITACMVYSIILINTCQLKWVCECSLHYVCVYIHSLSVSGVVAWLLQVDPVLCQGWCEVLQRQGVLLVLWTEGADHAVHTHTHTPLPPTLLCTSLWHSLVNT